ncbi:MAG: lipoate--protein ligase family protein [Spirochaetes bacterium]|jgi:lipoate-protein ligase A|nr:lipoate--protein ligase family protein [Spirochaetota bacterium]
MDPSAGGTWNMAVDCALLKSVSNGGSPVLRLYSWKPPAITIGYFQIRDEETDLRLCEKMGIDVIRRITGGGSVYHDNEITYSITAPADNKKFGASIIDSYRIICGAIVSVLRQFKIDAEFAPINDIVVKGKKISGNAQTRREGVLSQHGTLLLSVDKPRMFSLLKISREKISDKGVSDASERITSIEEQLGPDALSYGFISEFSNLLIDKLGSIFEVEFDYVGLNSDETDFAKKIEKDLFKNAEWNDKRKKWA